MTSPDARFHTLYAPLTADFENEGKDLVLQYQVRHTQKLDCGGGYIKLVPASVSADDMKAFGGETPYSIMFGPDICGSTRKVRHPQLLGCKHCEPLLLLPPLPPGSEDRPPGRDRDVPVPRRRSTSSSTTRARTT